MPPDASDFPGGIPALVKVPGAQLSPSPYDLIHPTYTI